MHTLGKIHPATCRSLNHNTTKLFGSCFFLSFKFFFHSKKKIKSKGVGQKKSFPIKTIEIPGITFSGHGRIRN